MKPLKQKQLVFENKCGCIVDLKILSKAMIWYAGKTLMQKRVIYLHGKYPAISIYNEKIHVHRLLAMFKYKDKIATEIHAHHKDENKLNASWDNIELVKGSVHLSKHNKGRVFSKEHKSKISEANKKRFGIKMKRRYNIPVNELRGYLRQGKSIREISIIYGCDWSVIKNRINETPNLLPTP